MWRSAAPFVTRQTVAVGPAARRCRASNNLCPRPVTVLVTVDRRLQDTESASVCRSRSRWTGSVRTSPKNPSEATMFTQLSNVHCEMLVAIDWEKINIEPVMLGRKWEEK